MTDLIDGDFLEITEEEYDFLWDFLFDCFERCNLSYRDHIKYTGNKEGNWAHFIEKKYLIDVITPIIDRFNEIKEKCENHD